MKRISIWFAELIFGSVATALQHGNSGRLRALAVTTPRRIAAAPEVPAVAEAGFPAYEVTNWHGLVAWIGQERENRSNYGAIQPLIHRRFR